MNVTTEELDSRATIELVGVMLAKDEPIMLSSVLARCANHLHAAKTIKIYCDKRRSDGWIEWVMRVEYTSGHGITIGAVQRQPGGAVEFHS